MEGDEELPMLTNVFFKGSIPPYQSCLAMHSSLATSHQVHAVLPEELAVPNLEDLDSKPSLHAHCPEQEKGDSETCHVESSVIVRNGVSPAHTAFHPIVRVRRSPAEDVTPPLRFQVQEANVIGQAAEWDGPKEYKQTQEEGRPAQGAVQGALQRHGDSISRAPQRLRTEHEPTARPSDPIQKHKVSDVGFVG